MTTVFYSETTLGGKFQVMSSVEISGKGVKKHGVGIVSHHNVTYGNLNNYWVTGSALEKIKSQFVVIKTSF